MRRKTKNTLTLICGVLALALLTGLVLNLYGVFKEKKVNPDNLVNSGISGYDIVVSVPTVDPFMPDPVVEIAKNDLFVRFNSGRDLVDRKQNRFICCFQDIETDNISFQKFCRVVAGKPGNFGNQFRCLSIRNESGGLQSIHKDMQFREFKGSVRHIV